MTRSPSSLWLRGLALLVPALALLAAWYMLDDDEPDPEGPALVASAEIRVLDADEVNQTGTRLEPAPVRLAPGARPGAREAGAAEPGLEPRRPIGDVQGRIVDLGGDPVSGARVSVRRLVKTVGESAPIGRSVAETTSAADGSFRLESVLAGRLVVWAEADGYAPAWRRGVGPGMEIVLSLAPGGHLQLRIEDDEGRPVEDAAIRYTVGNYSRSAQSDPYGVAVLRDLPVGRARLRVHGGQGAFSLHPVRVRQGETEEVTCILRAPVTLVGDVVENMTNRPLPGARVRVAYPDDPDLTVLSTRTDEDGRFAVGPISPDAGRVLVVASQAGYALGRLYVTGPATRDPSQPLRLELWRERKIRGRVLDPAGFPVAGARVWWGQSQIPIEGAHSTTVADSRGRFQVPLPTGPGAQGSFALCARTASGGFGATSIHGAWLGEEEVVIELRGAGWVSGTVRDENGRPRSRATVTLAPEPGRTRTSAASPEEAWARLRGLKTGADGSLDLQASTDAEGAYRLGPLPVGSYRVNVGLESESVRLRDRVEVRPGSEVVMDIELAAPSSIVGRVLDADGGPIAGAGVVASPVGGVTPAPSSVSTTTAKDGYFELTGVRGTGAWRLLAASPGHERGTLEGIRAGTRGVEIHLGRAAAVEGVVYDANGEAADGFRVWVTRGRVVAPWGDSRIRLVPTQVLKAADQTFGGTAGAFQFEGLRPGTYVLVAESLDGGQASRPTQVRVSEGGATEPSDLTLGLTCRLSGSVARATSRRPVANALVSVHPYVDDGLLDVPIATTRADARGRYELTDLPAGRYRVQAMGKGGRPLAEEIDLGAGSEDVLDLLLEDTAD